MITRPRSTVGYDRPRPQGGVAVSSARIFRSTLFAFAVVIGVSSFAASSNVGDGASWDERFLAFNSAAAPWIVSTMIVWAAGEIIKAINERPGQPGRDDT